MKHDIFSKRDVPDSEVLSYSIPTELLVQVIHIWDDVFRTILKYERNLKALMYYHTVQILRKEYGVMALLPTLPYSDDEAELRGFFLDQATVDERVVDVIELSFRVLSNAANDRVIEPEPSSLTLGAVKDAINELNERFREHGIGYEYIDGIVIRKDSEYIHSEVVKPALLILNEKEFRGSQR